MSDGLNGLLDRLRKQASQSPAPQPQSPGAASSPSSIPKQQQYVHDVNSPVMQYQVPPADQFQYSYPMNYNTQNSNKTQTSYNSAPSGIPQPTEQAGTNRTENLLGLLRFTQAAPSITPQPSMPAIPREAVLSPPPMPSSNSNASTTYQQSHQQPQQPQQQPHQQAPILPPHNRTISAQDLVASLLGRSGQQGQSSEQANTQYNPSGVPPAEDPPTTQPTKTPVNPQDLVMQLLGRPKPPQDEQAGADESNQQHEDARESTSKVHTPAQRSPTFLQHPSPSADRVPSPAADQDNVVPPPASPPAKPAYTQPGASGASSSSAAPAKSLFTYVNPFEQLHATSPRNRTPKPNNVPNGVKRNGFASGGPKATEAVNPLDIPLPFSPSPRATEHAKIEIDEKEILQKLKDDLDKAGKKRESEQESIAQEATERSGEAETVKPRRVEKDEEQTNGADQPNDGEQTVLESTNNEHSKSVSEPADNEEDDFVQSGPIKVYNFPMKPFSQIIINAQIPNYERPRFPSAKMSEIARMPRQFDQLDRNLIAASSSFIVYAISKSNGRGGIRILRQEDGRDMVLNKDTTDRTFNVVIGRGERLLGTSVSGAVVWADVVEGFERAEWQNHSFVFPPSEEQGQTNGVLKSRARKSCRHIDVFAIGRGKAISIIHAPTAKTYAEGRKGNEVASKKYLAEHSRIIDTGKASKDFCFSEDDTVIISIDKAGKLKLWDVQDLVTFGGAYTAGIPPPPQPPMRLKEPAIVLSAVLPGESYRATSVMFLDKFRPFAKGLALRYVIVGMKQNHTLQLWDLALGRPVQEIHFPQSSDTDALCSVAYHPPTGIVVVGNPTRNSIYFIHLSAPKYSLPPQSQAQYIKNLALKSDAIPKPDATAILSGLREYSLDSKGQLMSLDILDGSNTEVEEGESQPLFELYVAHSKGMTSLSVYKEDLGWDNDCKTKISVDALQAKLCTISPMPVPPIVPEPGQDITSPSSGTPEEPKAAIVQEKISRRGSPIPALIPLASPPSPTAATAPIASPPVATKQDKPEKEQSIPPTAPAPRKKKGSSRGQQQPQVPVPSDVSVSISSTEKSQEKPTQDKGTGQRAKNGALNPPNTSNAPSAPVDQLSYLGLTPAMLEQEVKKIEGTVSAEFNKVISYELEKLYKTFGEDRRVQDAVSNARHEAILKLLSSTLSDNVEHVLADIVNSNIERQVVPAIINTTSSVIERRLTENIGKAVNNSFPNELRAVLPDAIKMAITHPDVLGKINETVGKSLAATLTGTVDRELQRLMQMSIFPAFQQLAIDTARKVVQEADIKNNATLAAMERIHEQDTRKIDHLIATHQHDSRKIDQLMGVVQQLSETVAAMSRAQTDLTRQQADMLRQQTEFQDQVQRAQAEWMQGQAWPEEEEPVISEPPRAAPPPPSPEELERQEIDGLFRTGRFEEATIRWLQSKDRQEELFDEVVKRYRFDFMPQLSQLVLLSVSAAVTVNFENSSQERLNWLEGVLSYLDPRHPEIHEICQRIMAVVVQRLEQSFMRIAQRDPNNAALGKIPRLAEKARELGNLNMAKR